MSSIIVKENESLDSALRRFKRSCAKAGIQQEIRKREHYEKPSVKRKRNLKLLENENINKCCKGHPVMDVLFHAVNRRLLRKNIAYICDFRRVALNVRSSARIQHLLPGHRYRLYSFLAACFLED